MVSKFGPQNQAEFGLSVAPQNRREDATTWDTRRDPTACFAWRQVGLGFPSLAWRLVEARWWVVHVAPSWRLRRGQAEDRQVDATRYIGPFYPRIVIFYVLGHGGIIVSFAWAYKYNPIGMGLLATTTTNLVIHDVIFSSYIAQSHNIIYDNLDFYHVSRVIDQTSWHLLKIIIDLIAS
jgi:hypothetical protein